jgi:hypothetical protein
MEQTSFSNPLDPSLFPSLVLVAVFAWIVFGSRKPPSFWRLFRGQLEQLGNELDRHVDRERWMRRLPVFSAETTRGKEAEFIRERLSRRSPRALFVIALLVAGVLVWWLTR